MKLQGWVVRNILFFVVVFTGIEGCGTRIHTPGITLSTENNAILLGRISTQLTGPTTRYFQPAIQFFEIKHQESGRQYRVDIDAQNAPMVFTLVPGNYILTRIMISEGVFRALANLELSFKLEKNRVNYLGTWEVRVSAPFYNRTIQVGVLSQLDQTLADLRSDNPSLTELPIVSQNLTPSFIETRLFEVAPYPKFRYFNRHHTT